MYARVVNVSMKPHKSDESLAIWQESVVPAVKRQAGFKGLLVLATPGRDKSMSVTLWETEADMKANESSGYFQEQVDKFADLIGGRPILEHYEVILEACVADERRQMTP
ncbi:MAG: antibiotic biosynthesis monooxygenase [Gammaproteobacteria bacterium]|nr:antibiotic biosynthesis monooxygenase [Gammaproteobacteria bacterium]MCI0590995.1 antibiotic biosynthesis monooxygenase [Gammaproteobacteria bacterium]